MGREDFGIGKRDLTCEHNWRSLDIEEYRITKPTILCFGGNASVDPESANGICKIATNLIGLKTKEKDEYATTEMVDVIGVAYGDKSGRKTGTLTEEEQEKIVYNMLLPLFYDKKGELLSVEEACRNFSKITFFSHCYGCEALDKVLKILKNRLIQSGYTAEEVQKIYDCAMHISYAPCTERCLVPTVEILSFSDFVLNLDTDDAVRALKDREDVNLVYNEKDRHLGARCIGGFRPIESIGIYALRYGNDSSSHTEHSVSTVSRDENWNIRNDAKLADCASQIAGYALARSVANSIENQVSDTYVPKISMSELYEELETVKKSFNANKVNKR